MAARQHSSYFRFRFRGSSRLCSDRRAAQGVPSPDHSMSNPMCSPPGMQLNRASGCWRHEVLSVDAHADVSRSAPSSWPPRLGGSHASNRHPGLGFCLLVAASATAQPATRTSTTCSARRRAGGRLLRHQTARALENFQISGVTLDRYPEPGERARAGEDGGRARHADVGALPKENATHRARRARDPRRPLPRPVQGRLYQGGGRHLDQHAVTSRNFAAPGPCWT